jgi:hypothetical protein
MGLRRIRHRLGELAGNESDGLNLDVRAPAQAARSVGRSSAVALI